MPDKSYEKIQKLRKLILEEMRQDFAGAAFTVEHFTLLEMRLQSILMADKVDLNEVDEKISADIVSVKESP